MVGKYCPDCGCRMNKGICSNCQEELYITVFQSEDMVYPVSKEFREKAEEQQRYIERRNRNANTANDRS